MPRIVPPAPPRHAAPLPFWELIRRLSKSTISIWGQPAYEIMVAQGERFGLRNILVNDPEGIRHIAAGDAKGLYVKSITTRRLVRAASGNGLVLSEGEAWRRQRRMLAPAFTPAHVGLFLPHFAEAANALIAGLEGQARVNLSKAFQEAALDAACRALFSMPIGGHGRRLASLARAYVKGPGRPRIWDSLARSEGQFAFMTPGRFLFRWLWRKEVRRVIAARLQHLDGRAGRRQDLLDLLIAAKDPETGAGLSDQDLQDQTSTFIAAGFETTARVLFWTCYLLTLAPEEQARLRAEVKAFPPDRVQSLADINRWPRLRQVLLESMRLYPPAPLYTRMSTGSDEVCGRIVEAGTLVMISPWLVHRHRRLWPDPDAFDPDRFEGKPQDYLSNGAYIPFGVGPRTCIGASFALAEASLILAKMLERFEIALDDERQITPISIITIMPDIEPWFRLTPAG